MLPGPPRRPRISMISTCSKRCASAGMLAWAADQPATSSMLIAPGSPACIRCSARRTKVAVPGGSAAPGAGRDGRRPIVKHSRPGADGFTRPESTIGVAAASAKRSTSGDSRPWSAVADNARPNAEPSPALNRRAMLRPTNSSGSVPNSALNAPVAYLIAPSGDTSTSRSDAAKAKARNLSVWLRPEGRSATRADILLA